MAKKQVLIAMLILAMSAQLSLADNVTFKSSSKSESREQLNGILTKPEGDGPFPAIVVLHGCSGNKPTHEGVWAERFVSWGYVALQVDSLTTRGAKSCREISPFELIMSYDAHAARAYLKSLPFVDAERIALMGRAAGASATLTAIENYKEPRRTEPFTAAVSLSPFCPYQLVKIDAPVLLLIGEKDDWTTIAGCEDIKLIEASQYSVTTKIYPGVTHGFDVERSEPLYYWGGHVSEHNPEATQDAIMRIREFFGRHLKK